MPFDAHPLEPCLLLERVRDLQDAVYERIGVVVDADREPGGGGFSNRWNALVAPLQSEALGYGRYRIRETPPEHPDQGSLFENDHAGKSLPPVGLWIMPNHHDDGTLEDLLRRCIRRDDDQDRLIGHADESVKGLPVRLFKDAQETKARLYTWLAWQKRPGYTLDVMVRGDLLDHERQPLAGLVAWLRRLFPAAP